MDSRWFHSHPNLANLEDYENTLCPCKESKMMKKKKKKKLFSSSQPFFQLDPSDLACGPQSMPVVTNYCGKSGGGKGKSKVGNCFSQNNLLCPYGCGLDRQKSRSSSDINVNQMGPFGPSSHFQMDHHHAHPHHHHHHRHHCPSQSRQDMLNWVNGCLNSNYTAVEELGSGLAYCQLMNLLWPGCVSLKKIKFYARHEQERVHNFRVLEAALKKFQVYKVIPIEKLVKGRFQDNFDFLQWFVNFWMGKYNGASHTVNLKGLGGPPTSGAVAMAARMNLPLVGGMARLPMIGYGNCD